VLDETSQVNTPVGGLSDHSLELAYDAANQALGQQDDTLSNVRNRAIAILSAATLAISFSASVGLISGDGKLSRTFSQPAAFALLVVLIALGGLVISVLWPVAFHFGPDAASILDLEAQGRTEAEIRKIITKAMIAGAGVNIAAIVRKQRSLRLSAMLLVVEIAILLADIVLN
jgi:hypothetical protein